MPLKGRAPSDMQACLMATQQIMTFAGSKSSLCTRWAVSHSYEEASSTCIFRCHRPRMASRRSNMLCLHRPEHDLH